MVTAADDFDAPVDVEHAPRDSDGLPVIPGLGCWIPCTDTEFDNIYHANGGTEGAIEGFVWDETLRVLGLTRDPLGDGISLPLLAVVNPWDPELPAVYRLQPSQTVIAAMLCGHAAPVTDCLEPATGYLNGLFHCRQHTPAGAS